MSDATRQYWSKLIGEQEASGQNAWRFCQERGVSAHSFYKWRKRLRGSEPVRFALLETGQAGAASPDSALELVLGNGERLRIANGVDAATLRLVLDALRA